MESNMGRETTILAKEKQKKESGKKERESSGLDKKNKEKNDN